MRVTVTWEASDIRPGRRIVSYIECDETWVIGYAAGSCEGDPGRWGLVSTRDFAMCPMAATTAAMARLLTTNKNLPAELVTALTAAETQKDAT